MLADEEVGCNLNMGCAYQIWRGTPMKNEWIEQYEKQIGQEINLSGNNSFTKDPKVALGFAIKKPWPECVPVLFVLTCHNFQEPKGFLMDHDAYSGYPQENEFLLMDGCNAYVLAIEHDFKIQNTFKNMREFNGL